MSGCHSGLMGKWLIWIGKWQVVDRKDFGLALDIIAAVRDAVGPEVDILIEGHNRFRVHTALQFAEAIAPYKPTCFEAPVPPQRVSAMAAPDPNRNQTLWNHRYSGELRWCYQKR
jgi:L-alanine-DL-glutamate epimerase-like enolase superfamily enzyme